MKLKAWCLFSALALVLLGTTASHAGMIIYNPPGGVMNGYFTIQYGLGTPEPGKIAYIYVTDPSGSYYEVAQAEKMSQTTLKLPISMRS